LPTVTVASIPIKLTSFVKHSIFKKLTVAS
jgi:hypothetical protein